MIHHVRRFLLGRTERHHQRQQMVFLRMGLARARRLVPGQQLFQPLLRRFDHAGIFVMIAGSSTPFTTQHLTGAWAWGMTSAVWAIAAFAALAKLFLPGLGKGFWIVVYLALGWLMVIAIQPILQSLGLAPLILMLVGGLLYSVGVIFYANKAMRFRRAIWHGHVVVAAAVHWVAVLLAVLK